MLWSVERQRERLRYIFERIFSWNFTGHSEDLDSDGIPMILKGFQIFLWDSSDYH